MASDSKAPISRPPSVFTKTYHHRPYPAISPTRPELSAKGKNIVITGGGTGIGNAIGIAFAQAGASSVSILGRREDRLISGAKAIKEASSNKDIRVLYYVTDITDRKAVDASMDAIVDKVGKISVFVSNAGTLPPPVPVISCDVEDFMAGFDVNVRGALNVVQAFASRASTNAVLINISTVLVHIAPFYNAPAYTACKAATLKIFDYFADENPEINVFSIQPGGVATEINAPYNIATPDSAELPGQFCVWLASPEAQFLKSKFVWSNWDVNELMERADEIQNSRLLTVVLDGVVM